MHPHVQLISKSYYFYLINLSPPSIASITVLSISCFDFIEASYLIFWPPPLNPSYPSLCCISHFEMQISHHIPLFIDPSVIKVKLLNTAYPALPSLPPTPIIPTSPPLHHSPGFPLPQMHSSVGSERGRKVVFPNQTSLHSLCPLKH